MSRYIIGIDQSTSGTTALLIDEAGQVAASTYQPVARFTPRPGWVEQDPVELWLSTRRALRIVVEDARISPDDVEAIGIANQRETMVVWDRNTGEPVGRAIGWQDRRTLDFCETRSDEERSFLEAETGMSLVPNAAGPKINWLLENDRSVQRGMAAGDLLCGTVDSWVIWNLSGRDAHITDHSNASVTLLQNARTLTYSDRALEALGIPRDTLPDLRSSSEIYATTAPEHFLGSRVPIAGCIGDQQASLLGQSCVTVGMAKNTYGAGSFMILNVGDQYLMPNQGTFSPILWSIDGAVSYGVEFMTDDAGSVLNWLRDGLGIINNARDAEALAGQVPDTGGLYFVSTLGRPGASEASVHTGGILMGLNHQSTRHHIARAALEAIAFQTRDALEAIRSTAGIVPAVLRVDGGGARNDFLMQFQADILGIPVERPVNLDTTPLGAAHLAGVAVGFWDSLAEASATWRQERLFEPKLTSERREARYAEWLEARSFTTGLSLSPRPPGKPYL